MEAGADGSACHYLDYQLACIQNDNPPDIVNLDGRRLASQRILCERMADVW